MWSCGRYDGAGFDNASKLMQLYDVGMSSLLVAELHHLAARTLRIREAAHVPAGRIERERKKNRKKKSSVAAKKPRRGVIELPEDV